MSTQITRAPKRRIEKSRSRINFTITDTEGNLTLHTAEDSKTLVRTLVDLYLTKIVVGVSDAHIIMENAPAGQQVITPVVTQVLAVPAPTALIMEKSMFGQTVSEVGFNQTLHWSADSKGMRKMKEVDKIKLRYVSDVASSWNVTGHITQWFKE